MTEKLKEVVKEELAKLSKEAQQAIATFDWLKTAEEIGKKSSLSESEVNNFQVETLLIITGLEEPELYQQNVEQELKISKEVAKKITDEAFGKIFEPIANIMQENVKKSLQGKNTSPVQNVNFILSGGDYSVFLENANNKYNPQPEQADKLIGTSNILETKNKLLE